MNRGTLIVLSGPSGVGKSTVVQHLKTFDAPIWISISMTTREQRAGETQGKEYFFVSREEFENTIASGDMLEWAEFDKSLTNIDVEHTAAQLLDFARSKS